jgi:SPP1 family phage portal protein
MFAGIGWQSSLHGLGYELLYNEGLREEPTLIDNLPGYLETEPRFAKAEMAETIPIYDFDIIPNLRAFIRFYTMENDEYISVYYEDVKEDWVRTHDQSPMTRMGEQPHGYSAPPLVVYENNEDAMGDFAAVQALIDAYDVMMSDSLNEFDRFAQAYLVAKGFTITGNIVGLFRYFFNELSTDLLKWIG